MAQGLIYCPICSKGFDTRDEYNEHRKYPCGQKETAVVKEPQPTAKMSPEATVYDMYNKGNAGYCPFPGCNRYFDNMASFKYHIKSKHIKDFPFTDPNSKFPCPDCNLRFSTEQGLKSHTSLMHNPDVKRRGPKTYQTGYKPPEPVEQVTDTPRKYTSVCMECLIFWVGDIPLKVCPLCTKATIQNAKEVKIKEFSVKDLVR